MSRGIPPSPDRIDSQRMVAVAGAAAVVIVLVGLLLMLRSCPLSPGALTPGIAGDQEEMSPEERERRSAYYAVQREIEQRLLTGSVVQIYWRENMHEVRGGAYLFEGFMDLEYAGGGLERTAYRAVVRPAEGGAWEPVELEAGGEDILSGRIGQ